MPVTEPRKRLYPICLRFLQTPVTINSYLAPRLWVGDVSIEASEQDKGRERKGWATLFTCGCSRCGIVTRETGCSAYSAGYNSTVY